MSTRGRWGLFGILVAGLALRCIALSSRSIQYDDAFSILLAQQNYTQIISGTAADTMPPLYYFLLHLWMQLGGRDLGWLRFLSVLLNLGGLLAMYGIVRALAGETAGLWAAFLGVISPLQIYHAQDLRMYALLATAQLAYCWFFIRIFQEGAERPAWLNWAGLVAAGTAAMYTHDLAVFVLVIPDLYLFLRRDWRRLVRLLAAQVVIGLLALPWLVMVPGQIAKIQTAFWTPRPGLVEVVQSIVYFTTNLPLPGIWLSVGLIVSLIVLAMLLWQCVRLWRDHQMPPFLLALAFVPPILLFLASYLMRPVFVTRGFLAASLGYLALAGVVLARVWPKIPAGLMLSGLVIGAGVGLPAHYTFSEFPRSPYQAAMATIKDQIQPGDRIIHDNKLSFFPSWYYAPDLPQSFLADEPGSPNDTLALASQEAMGLFPQSDLQQAVGNSQRIYFVVFSETIQEYLQAGLADHPHLAWLKDHFKLVSETQFNDLLVYEFSRQDGI